MGMRRFAVRWVKRLALVGLGGFAAVLAGRAWQSQSAPPLALWHEVAPAELPAAALDATDWPGWLAAEARAFAQLQREVSDALPAEARTPENRYSPGSAVYPAGFAQDWNRSYVLEPDGPPRGAVVLLHGLTDAPYSMRHIAALYREAGFIAIGLRVPGHGTTPAALAEAVWEGWSAATRLAMREARRRVGPSLPVHIVGYSNGGALALKHALDALENPTLVRPARVVLLSPMIGVSAFAGVAWLAALPARLPRFAQAAWLSNLPEFNPFKYNSFPVNGAVQTHRLTQVLQAQIRRLAGAGRLAELAPVLAFQSVLDSTVLTQSLIDAFFALLPEGGHEMVLFDRNRASPLGVLLRPAADPDFARMLPPAPRNFRLSIIANAAGGAEVSERATAARATAETLRPLGLNYPRDIFSLSHTALPFPAEDGLYGSAPATPGEFGVMLGAVAARGETGALVMSLETLARVSWNPFFPYLRARIAEALAP